MIEVPIRWLIDPVTGCWLWQGATNSGGYGVVYRQRRARKLCVNPEHMRALTRQEHAQAHSRLTWLDIYELICLRKEGLTLRDLGEHFGLHPNHVSRILRGGSWT